MPQICPNTAMDVSTEIDPGTLRDALGTFATGVAIATTIGDGGVPVGLTISSFNSVSLDPALVLWSLAKSAPSIGAFRNHGHFAINILAENQHGVCMQFARPSEDKFSGIPFRPGHAGVPLIDGSAAHFECSTHARYPGGDHEIFVGEVLQLSSSDHAPLVFHRGQFKSVVERVA
jgi:3-hydroxy-9,10-secoandrosta-1,3,5(10)-triene-9,17-dione monooxygenase reductase component